MHIISTIVFVEKQYVLLIVIVCL